MPPQRKHKDQDNDPAWWIEREPEPAAALALDIAVDAVEEVTPDVSRMVPVSGGVRAIVVATGRLCHRFTVAMYVEMPMRLECPERYRDPGAWQYADYLLEQGMSVHANVRAAKVTNGQQHAIEPAMPTVCCSELGIGSDAQVPKCLKANQRLPAGCA